MCFHKTNDSQESDGEDSDVFEQVEDDQERLAAPPTAAQI